ncbi:MAG: ribonuclease J [Cyanobacteria bacterium QS_8_64_29]|nr:MAG: ribonuclease J [Cyanobacteria bacterium QS_8_64_29]
MSSKQSDAASPLNIIPLGGLHEVGKNTCIFECGEEMFLLDGGIGFPSEQMHGVNVVLPDMRYVRQNRHKIKGMVVTHGHEDHIGGIAYYLQQFDIPVIYGPRLALSLLQGKLEEANVADRTELKSVGPREVVQLGSAFAIEFIRNTHSLADSFCLAVRTPAGTVIHTGDFKVDHTPPDGETFDLHRLAEYGASGVLCLLSDSTNAETPGHTPSEQTVYPNLDHVFAQATGRLMVTTFASSIHRIGIILALAQKHGRTVSVVGRSMLNAIAHARNLGYIHCPDSLFEPLKSLARLPESQQLVLTTGSQGEPMAAMTRIARGEHPQLQAREGDTIAFSANPIPGNTIAVVDAIDRLMAQGAHVVYGREQGIHVSGHGSQEDQKLILALVRPQFFVPVHGEYRMLVKHAQMAQQMGIPSERTALVQNGDTLVLTPNDLERGEPVLAGIELVDRAGIVRGDTIKERQQLAADGVITVAATLARDGTLAAQPQVQLQGVVNALERSAVQRMVSQSLSQLVAQQAPLQDGGRGEFDWTRLKTELESNLQRLVQQEFRSSPATIVLLQVPAQDGNGQAPSEAANRPRTRRRRRSKSKASSPS